MVLGVIEYWANQNTLSMVLRCYAFQVWNIGISLPRTMNLLVLAYCIPFCRRKLTCDTQKSAKKIHQTQWVIHFCHCFESFFSLRGNFPRAFETFRPDWPQKPPRPKTGKSTPARAQIHSCAGGKRPKKGRIRQRVSWSTPAQARSAPKRATQRPRPQHIRPRPPP